MLNALQLKDLKITLRALGLIGKLVTGPWMRAVPMADSILGTNIYFNDAYVKLKALSQDATPMIKREAESVFPAVGVLKDCVFDGLTESNSTDEATIRLLQDLCTACIDVMGRQMSSQLPEGKFWNPSVELLKAASSCPPTNISGERNFAMCDMEFQRAPNAKYGFVESRVIYKVNKTPKWLSSKTEAEKDAEIDVARKASKLVRTQARVDTRVHELMVDQKLLSNRKVLLEKEDRNRAKYEKWLELAFENGGLWMTEESMRENVDKI